MGDREREKGCERGGEEGRESERSGALEKMRIVIEMLNVSVWKKE